MYALSNDSYPCFSIPPAEPSTSGLQVSAREALLNHNPIYRILKKANLVELTKRALRGTNDQSNKDVQGGVQVASGPATLAKSESKELSKQWLNYIVNVALAKGKQIDDWSISVEDYVRWADYVVQCFPGENKDAWYSPKPAATPVSIV